MDHATTTTDTDALLAEVDALLEQADATSARVDALLDGWAPRPTTGQRMAALWAGVEQLRRWNDQDEAELADLRAEIEALEQGA